MTAQTVALILIAVIVALGSGAGMPPEPVEIDTPPTSDVTTIGPMPATVRVHTTHLHDRPRGGDVVAQLHEGDPVTVLDANELSYFVRSASGDAGWVERYAIRLVNTHGNEKLYILGYYMQDSRQTARSILDANTDAMTALSPWSWGLTKEGRLRPVYFNERDLADVLAAAGRQGLETHVLIHNFDPDIGAFDTTITDNVLTKETVRTRAIEQIVQTARDWGVTGVHIDFEGVAAPRRDDLTAFMAALRKQLLAEGIGLSIAVPAKTFATAEGLWTKAYDYGALARHVDFIMVMAYDQHWAGGPPGPVAGLPWVRNVVEYAVDARGGGVPPEQLVLGVAAYGYDWPLSGSRPGEAVTFAETSRRFNAARNRDPAAEVGWHGEHFAPYLDYDGRRIWFENAHSLQYKLLLAREYGLHGVALWRIGQEDPELWPLLRTYN